MLDTLALNPLFRLRFDGGVFCDMLLEGRTLELPSPKYLELLAAFRKGATREDANRIAEERLGVDRPEAERIVDDLVAHRVLVSSEEAPPEIAQVKHWTERNWLDGLILHLRSRDLDYEDDTAAEPKAANDRLLAKALADEPLPELWKEYPGADRFVLPAPAPFLREEPLASVLLRRRSNQMYRQKRISLEVLARMLITGNEETVRLREAAAVEIATHPSALLRSAYSALETYVFVHDVADLAPGLYHYHPRDRALVRLREGSFRDEVQKMCIGQNRAGTGACSFVLTAVWKRYMYRYRHPRAYRNLMVNVAELAQRYIVLATAMDLNTFLTPNLINDYADELIGVNGYEEGVLYVVTAG